jgi:chemotaxis protein CheZ
MTHDDANLQAAIDRLCRVESLELDDALALAETSIRALTALAEGEEGIVEGRIDEMAGRVSRLKHGITQLQAHHLRNRHIPEAGSELDATVEATELAASRIMEAAEAILEADGSKPKAYRETVNAQIMAIFEACAFQDITGQRISKVRDNLNSIDARVARFAEAVGAPAHDDPDFEPESARDKRRRELILNGPSRDGEGVSQDEIDALLNS